MVILRKGWFWNIGTVKFTFVILPKPSKPKFPGGKLTKNGLSSAKGETVFEFV